MTLFGLTMEQGFACGRMRIQFGTMAFLSCREAASLNPSLQRDALHAASRHSVRP